MSETRTTLCLVRHGATEWNASGRMQGLADIELSEMGVMQAHRTGTYLAKESWDAILTSPLARTRTSAEAIASLVGLGSPAVVLSLIERDYGEASGMTSAEISARWPEGEVPGMESRDSLDARAAGVLSFVADSYAGQRVLAVSHGALINAILRLVSNGDIGSGKTVLANACVSVLHCVDGVWTVESYNSTEHLSAPAK